MPATEHYGTILAVGVATVALALLAWQINDRANRGPDLSLEDATHFQSEDRRRGFVFLVMLVVAAGIHLGSHVKPSAGGRPNPLFVEAWLGVTGLVLLLLLLALIDWTSTRRFARRHRQQMAREGIEILRDELRLRTRPTSDGPTHDPQ